MMPVEGPSLPVIGHPPCGTTVSFVNRTAWGREFELSTSFHLRHASSNSTIRLSLFVAGTHSSAIRSNRCNVADIAVCSGLLVSRQIAGVLKVSSHEMLVVVNVSLSISFESCGRFYPAVIAVSCPSSPISRGELRKLKRLPSSRWPPSFASQRFASSERIGSDRIHCLLAGVV